jgi:large subunit ribosomal protein L10
MARPDKAAAVAELTEAFRSSNAAVLTEYRGLTVAQLKALRRALQGNAEYHVVKNTLTKIAAKQAGVSAFDSMLAGPSAIAFVSGDPVEVAKGLRDFAKANPLLVIKGGVLDGKPLSGGDISKLADLESREVLLAKLAGAMIASLSQAAALFQAPLSKAARTVEALRAQLEAGAPPAPEAEAAPADEAAVPTAAEPAPADGAAVLGAAEATPADEAPADEAPEWAETAPADEAAVAEAPAAQATAEEPTAEASGAEEPTAEEPTAEEPTAEAPTPEAPTAEEPTAEEPTAEAPTPEAPTAE